MGKVYNNIKETNIFNMNGSISETYNRLYNKSKKLLTKRFGKWKHMDYILPEKSGWYICTVSIDEEIRSIPLRYQLPNKDDAREIGYWVYYNKDGIKIFYDPCHVPASQRNYVYLWRELPKPYIDFRVFESEAE